MLIGLTGNMGAGKSTVADYLVEKKGFVKISFATPLKGMLRALGLSEEHIHGNLKEAPCELLGGKTPRYAMQTLGTEWGRQLIHPDIWLNAWQKRVKGLGAPVVADDCRFLNEAKLIRQMGGKVWRVFRGQPEYVEHASEVEMRSIVPDKDVYNFYEDVRELHKLIDTLVVGYVL